MNLGRFRVSEAATRPKVADEMYGSRSLGVPCSKRPGIGICHDVGATLPMEARNETRGKSTTMVGRVGESEVA